MFRSGFAGLLLVPAILSTALAQCEFDAAIVYDVGDAPASIAAGDLDGDGDLDLAVANSGSFFTPLSLLFNDGDGNFTHTMFSANADTVLDLALGDLNNDSDLDILTANSFDNFIGQIENDGMGNFSSNGGYDTGMQPFSVSAANLDADNHLDIVVLDYGKDVDEDPNQIAIINSQSETQHVEVGFSIFTPTLFDIQGDGDIDLAVASVFDDRIFFYLNDGFGEFAPGGFVTVASGIIGPASIVHGDFDNDLDIDIATGNQFADSVSILINDGTGSFLAQPMVSVGDSPRSVVVDDFDNDLDLDLAVANNFDDTVSVLINDGIGSYTECTNSPMPVGDSPISIVSGDFNQDGASDIATANTSDNTISVLFNSINGKTIVGDVNLDGVVNLLDVAPFVALITSGEFQVEADVNQDGVVNLLDVSPFVSLLTGQ